MGSEIVMDGGYIRIWTERQWFAVMRDEIDLTAKKKKSLERTGIWPWVPTGPETKNDGAGEGEQQLTGLDWNGRYVEVRKDIPVTGRGVP
jgi:hypothetical protein